MPALHSHPPDYRQHLEVETPEHVLLDLEIAGIGSRAFAAILDLLLLGAATLAVLIVLTILAGSGLRLGPWGLALLILGGFAAWTGYFIVFEGLRRGQTPGKRVAGIRVVMDTGHAVTLSAAAVRNLLRPADFLPPPYLLGTLLVAFHPRGKRLGDLAAGTVVARDRPDRHHMPPGRTLPSEPTAGIAELSEAEFRLLSRFATRYAELAPAAGARLASGLARRLAGHPAPAGVSDLDHLLALYDRDRARRERGLTAPGAGGAGSRLAARKEARWDAFAALAERAAGNGLDSFRSGELPDFAARYREVAADLARARTYGADPATLAQLDRLAAAGHNALYRDRGGGWGRVWEVLARECPAAIVRARGYVAVAFLAFMVPAAAGFTLLRERPELAEEVLPDVMLRRAEAGAGRQATGHRYVEIPVEQRPIMASGIITNNVRVAIACFAGGIFLGIGSLVLLAFNGLAIGASAGHFANVGLLGYLLQFIVGHGLLELFAIWVAGAAGFLLGRSVFAPGRLSRSDALVLSGRTAVRMLGATAVLLVVAGTIEGFISAGTGGLALRGGFSAASLGFLAVYLFGGAISAGRGTNRAAAA